MGDAEPLAVEGENVVVVVARDETRVEWLRCPRREIETTKHAPAGSAAAHVVEESFSVRHPVWRFERLLRAIERLEFSGVHLQDFELAADEIAIGREADFHGLDHSNVAKEGLLLYLGIV